MKTSKKIELAAYYKSRIRFPPKKGATATVMAGEIIEYLESNGERFFVNQGIEPLKRLHAKLGGKSRPSRFTDRGNLVRALRELKEYSYTNYQPTQQERPPQEASMNNRGDPPSLEDLSDEDLIEGLETQGDEYTLTHTLLNRSTSGLRISRVLDVELKRRTTL